LALSELVGDQSAEIPQDEPHLQFLGTSRGFTRQLRTVHAPPPEPPPPPQRHLRVLVVADPAADAHLSGAEEEGIAVADLFEQFNIVHAQSSASNRVEVVRLFGPREATRTTVLRHLMMRTYDVLHFAGHCLYDAKQPAKSGWIFSNGERLSAYEFTRIDRSPAFVFSNACESGVTPARSDERSVDLAPSFAEAFFARGVTNFVCTAWPVDDRAARDFALMLYAALLGLEPMTVGLTATMPHPSSLHSTTFRPTVPLSMHQAMMRARRAIAVPPSDTRTWGAYQHYGNPYFRFFDPASIGPITARAPLDEQAAPNQTPVTAETAPAVTVTAPAATVVPNSPTAKGRTQTGTPAKRPRARRPKATPRPPHANGVATSPPS
ncbi:MAG: CHAT domain-containing protein, partial [Microbacteriaceae bacterium]|nr:CHAT domain-containing protein [Microbacteriaceae bacterium]